MSLISVSSFVRRKLRLIIIHISATDVRILGAEEMDGEGLSKGEGAIVVQSGVVDRIEATGAVSTDGTPYNVRNR